MNMQEAIERLRKANKRTSVFDESVEYIISDEANAVIEAYDNQNTVNKDNNIVSN